MEPKTTSNRPLDPRPLKCPVCAKTATSLIEKLMMGPAGYRRYKVCMLCAKKADDQKKAK